MERNGKSTRWIDYEDYKFEKEFVDKHPLSQAKNNIIAFIKANQPKAIKVK